MSKALNSPTSHLLQHSRLFSLPRPLPHPQIETVTSAGLYRASDTATLPYPTHQAIATPASSHFRGDWGLKRALPAKATRGITHPHLRIKAHDNAAHITDFESALDHTRTEAKWREMGVPMVVKKEKQTEDPIQSVYDDNNDSTNPDPKRTTGGNSARWKHRGPWISGMSEGEFEIYITSRVAERKDAFRQFMIDRIVQTWRTDQERILRDGGKDTSISPYRLAEKRQEIESNYEAEEKRLREDYSRDRLNSELSAAIREFLDLPIIRSRDVDASVQTQGMRRVLSSWSEGEAPPSTHPGAGLSYLRSNSYMENHPVHGPQASRSPVLARVLRPRQSASGSENQAKLGVGGVVTSDIHSSFRHGRRPPPPDTPKEELYKDVEHMTEALNENLEGGNKIWVHPNSARIDESGHIRLTVARSDKEAIAVKTDDVEALEKARGTGSRDYLQGSNSRARESTSANRPPAPVPRARESVTGFDQQLSQASGGSGGEAGQARRIREILESHRNGSKQYPVERSRA